MALINESVPQFQAKRDADALELHHLEGYSGNRISDVATIQVGRDPVRSGYMWSGVNEPSIEYAVRRITVDKTTHRIRFENETESQVTIVIEPKEENR